jgi:twitching motility protein PilT
MELTEIVSKGVALHASDIHLSSNNRPACRVNGRVRFFDLPVLTADDVVGLIRQCLSDEKFEQFMKTGDMDSAAELPGCGRFRANAFRQTRGCTLVLRVINAATPELSDLNLPDSIRKILTCKDGLVLVTGPTGSGKSTTLAAIINEINKTRCEHIITIEDPIEYLHSPKKCIIDQREVGADSVSYARALKAALREDPDIILVGEMRDLESISIAVTAAETGHLVLSTLHTSGAAKTIDRLIDVFPPEQQQQIRTQLSMALRCVVSQHLLPTADGRGRVAAFEMMFVNNAVSNLIREGKTANITQMIQTGALDGMVTLENSLLGLIQKGVVSRAAAAEYLPHGFSA